MNSVKIKINLTFCLILAWLGLIIALGTISGIFSYKIGQKSLSQVQEPEIKRNQVSAVKSVNNQKLISEQEVLLKVNNYIELHKNQSIETNTQSKTEKVSTSNEI